MKKSLMIALMLVGVLGFSQQTKKKVYKKKPVRKSYSKKPVQKKTTVKETAIIETEPVKEVLEPVPTIQTVAEVQPVQEVQEDTEYIKLAEKVAKKKGWINNRNSAYFGKVEGFIKGVYSGKGKLFLLVQVDNRSNINYDIESISFNTAAINEEDESKFKELAYIPIWNNQPDNFNRKSTTKMVFVFNKFTLSDMKNLTMKINEADGERTLTLNIKPEYISKAEFIN